MKPGLHQAAHRDRHEHVRVVAERRAVEAARRDADDRHRLAVDDQRLVEDVGVEREARAPVVVAEHDDEVVADRLVVFGREEPSDRRRQAEHRKVTARHQQAVAARATCPDSRGCRRSCDARRCR